ncbi:unnamed protein product [Allacma fusca]|uniref:Uncharacterized protein n=1 Tax=Allacma fusca TaxID=39272 RepID=A0A8J2NR29_9HEXA|nr:unnamed protein product [Allacma fusca]
MTTAAKGETGQEDGFKKPWKRPTGAQRRKMTRMGKEICKQRVRKGGKMERSREEENPLHHQKSRRRNQ